MREVFGVNAVWLVGVAAATAAVEAPAAAQEESEGIVGAIAGGSPILDLRLRYAGIDQVGFAEDASALTLRTKAGWQTAPFRGFTGLIEFEDVRAIVEDYNSTQNGKGTFPVEADPEVTELNRAQIAWTNGDGLSATGGRQRIIFDNARFVGNVGWRQDEQTFDAVRGGYSAGNFSASYAYVWGVERIFAEAADFESDSHLLNASYTVSDAVKLGGFAYALDFEEAPGLSTATYGASISGAVPVADFNLNYSATLATQSDYGDNPADIDLGYGAANLSVAHGPFSLGGGYEVLEGDGANGFATPLATLHAFQGWADVFLNTPASGIEDTSVTARFAPDWSGGAVSNPALLVIWHDFSAEQGGGDLGSEIDVQLTARFTPNVTGVVKFADYDGPTFGPADRTKVWVGLQFTL
ncbi:MAG: alginate export family protein [Maricaulaceae bacterium]|jgi:hypothetical protein